VDYCSLGPRSHAVPLVSFADVLEFSFIPPPAATGCDIKLPSTLRATLPGTCMTRGTNWWAFTAARLMAMLARSLTSLLDCAGSPVGFNPR